LVGLGFLLALLALHLRLAYRLARDHRGTIVGRTAATLLAIQLGYALTGVFGITYHNYPTNLLAWLAMGLTQALARHAGERAQPLPAMRLARAVWPYRRRLVAFGLLAAVIAYGVCLLLPRSYRAATHVMVYADRQSSAASLLAAQAPFAAAVSDLPAHRAARKRCASGMRCAARPRCMRRSTNSAFAAAVFRALGRNAGALAGRTADADGRIREVWRELVFVDWFRATGVLRVTAQWGDPPNSGGAGRRDRSPRRAGGGAEFRRARRAKRRALQGEVAALDEQLAGVENELAAYRRENELVTPALQADAALAYWGDLWAARLEKDAARAMLLRMASPIIRRARLHAESAALAEAVDRLAAGAVPFLPPLDELARWQLSTGG
jgi:hypothetical protein